MDRLMAAPILSYEDLGLIQGEGWLFRGLDLYVGERDRLALIGRNGAGKTTLLKCLADLIDTDEGKRTIVPGTNIVLLEQDPVMIGFETLQDWVLHGVDAPERHEADAIAHQLEIDLSRPPQGLYPGAFVDTQLPLHGNPRPLVPTDALISVGGQMMVPLVEQNHVHFQRVKLGADDGAQVEVLDGLRGGEMVALNLGAEVSDGSPVRPQTAAAPAAR